MPDFLKENTRRQALGISFPGKDGISACCLNVWLRDTHFPVDFMIVKASFHLRWNCVPS